MCKALFYFFSEKIFFNDTVKFNLSNIQVGYVEHVLPGYYTVNRGFLK